MGVKVSLLAGVALVACGACESAEAATYEFLASPATDVNRVYRLDKATGEMGACQYALGENSIGETLCYPPGEGAGAQAQSEYALIASHHARESGIFRVDVRTGTMSVCYVLNEVVVCTQPKK